MEPLRSWGPILEWRRMGSPPPGVPPGDDAHEGAIRIFGVMSVLSERRLLGNAFTTRKKLLSGDDGDPPNHQPPSIPPIRVNLVTSLEYTRRPRLIRTRRVLPRHILRTRCLSLFYS